jgi:hypothetical protein
MALEKFKSSLFTFKVSDDPQEAQENLVLSAVILSMKYGELQHWLTSDWKQQIQYYIYLLYKSDKRLFEPRKLFSKDPYILKRGIVITEFNRLFEFLNNPDSNYVPAYKPTFKSESSYYSFHGMQSLILGAVKCGYTREQALDEHIQVVIYDVTQHSQNEGGITIMDPKEVDMVEHPEKYNTVIKEV